MSLSDTIILVCAVLCVGLCIFPIAQQEWHKRHAPDSQNSAPEISYLFKGDKLQHATLAAYNLADFDRDGNDWTILYTAIKDRFTGFPVNPPHHFNQITLRSRNMYDDSLLEIQRNDNFIKVIIRQQAPETLKKRRDDITFLAMNAATIAPYPIWLRNSKGEISWHNQAYAKLYLRINSVEPVSTAPLFNIPDPVVPNNGPTRQSLSYPNKKTTLWFDMSRFETEDGIWHYAQDVTETVHAEKAKHQFVQTLTKTFAQLPTGMGVFGNEGNLKLFNPAFLSLSRLPIEFMLSNPDITSVFEKMSDICLPPHAKDDDSWRAQISQLAAKDVKPCSSYRDTWVFDSGQTYQITVQPYSGGSLAFMIEDISATTNSSNQLREEIHTRERLLDSIEDALVVFTPNGILQFCNKSYRDIWQLDPKAAFIDSSIADALKHWKEQSVNVYNLENIYTHIINPSWRAPWTFEIELSHGQILNGFVSKIADGSTMVRFSQAPINFKPESQNSNTLPV